MTQKEQLAIMKEFREGKVNTLVCTCVAEEGLDIGEVDLVICFDINSKVGQACIPNINKTLFSPLECNTICSKNWTNRKEEKWSSHCVGFRG